MREKYPTRKKAVETLGKLLDSGILNTEIENEISDIMECIEEEEEGLFFWGARVRDLVPDDVHFIETEGGIFMVCPKDEAERIRKNYDSIRFDDGYKWRCPKGYAL